MGKDLVSGGVKVLIRCKFSMETARNLGKCQIFGNKANVSDNVMKTCNVLSTESVTAYGHALEFILVALDLSLSHELKCIILSHIFRESVFF